MRTTLDVEGDVLDVARALAVARGVSVGAPGFGPDEVRAATGREDLEAAREFLEPGR